MTSDVACVSLIKPEAVLSTLSNISTSHLTRAKEVTSLFGRKWEVERVVGWEAWSVSNVVDVDTSTQELNNKRAK